MTTRRLRAILATTFVVTQMAGFAHRALVAHVTCPEHGEIIHSRADGDGSTHDHAPPCLSSESTPSPDHEHDVCLVVLHQRKSVVATAAPALASATAAPQRTTIPVFTVRAPPESVYTIAPKTSPPV